MPTLTEMMDFVKEYTGSTDIYSDTDIFEDGTVGDDFHELMEKYAQTFSVDMTDYLWYFHADEEGGLSVGGLFFAPPYKMVERIPVTPAMLTEFAEKGRWNIKYPQHKFPKRRGDILVNQLFVVVVVSWLIIMALRNC